MARIRSVHPGLFTDEAFMAASPHARILMIGLWTEADDQGVFEWKPLTLKARLLPADLVDVAPLLMELEAAGVIRRFGSDHKPFGAIKNFRKFQRPQKPTSVHDLPPELVSFVGLDEAPEDADREYRRQKCEAQNGLCAYCGTEISHYSKRVNSLELDHAIPVSRGGTDADENIVASCRACNRSKCDMTADEFRAALAMRLRATTSATPVVAPPMEDGGCKGEKKEFNSGVRKNGRVYAFEHGVVRLTAPDLEKWRKAFPHVSIEGELIASEPWLAKEKSWFNAAAGLLAKREREAANNSRAPPARRREKDPLGNWIEVGADE